MIQQFLLMYHNRKVTKNHSSLLNIEDRAKELHKIAEQGNSQDSAYWGIIQLFKNMVNNVVFWAFITVLKCVLFTKKATQTIHPLKEL